MKAINTRCTSVSKAVQQAEQCPARVKEMLKRTIALTVGTPKADRHPFNDRFVAMIESVLGEEQSRLQKDVASNDAAFAELSPAKATREAALEQAKGVAVAANEALQSAKQAAAASYEAVIATTAELKKVTKEQKSGDEVLEGITVKRTMLEETLNQSLVPLVDGTAEDDAKKKSVLDVGKSFAFDSSLLSTAAQVLQTPAADRGGFDATCLQQLKDGFTNAIAKHDEELAAGALGKAERAAAVQAARAAKEAAEATQADLQEKATAAKQAKADAESAKKAAAHSLAAFMPDLKVAGDALDNAKTALQAFIDGPQVAFAELKEFKDEDFIPVKKPKVAAEPPTDAPEGTDAVAAQAAA